MRSCARWACLLLGLGWARPVSAQTETREALSVELEAELPSGCGTADGLGERVERMLGRTVFRRGPGPPPLRATLAIHAEHGGWAATITLADGVTVHGRRVLRGQGPSCEETTNAVALVLALMLDVSLPEATILLPEPELQRDVVRSERLGEGGEPRAPSAGRWELEAFLGGGGSLGHVPGIGTSARARLGLSLLDVVSFVVSAGLAPSDSFVAGGVGVRLGLLVAGLSVCPVLAHDLSFSLEACIGAEGGELAVAGVGLPVARESSLGVFSPVGELRGTWWLLGSLGLALSAEIGVPLVAHRFTATISGEERTLVAMEPVWGRLDLALRFRAELPSGSRHEPGLGREKRAHLEP
jgi:hypothetical protein